VVIWKDHNILYFRVSYGVTATSSWRTQYEFKGLSIEEPFDVAHPASTVKSEDADRWPAASSPQQAQARSYHEN
jgi:hypothetical protein